MKLGGPTSSIADQPDAVSLRGMSDAPRILVIDNYDSFVYILVQYLGELGAEPLVYLSLIHI